MGSTRRLSQRISEGDGIAIIVRVGDAEAARAAQEQGAKALAVDHVVVGIRDSSTLPVLWLAPAAPGDADVDAVAIRPTGADAEGLETVIEVRDEEELEEVFEVRDPEIVLISPRENGKDPLELALELLPDVPAGKLAIADVDVGYRELPGRDVRQQLERQLERILPVLARRDQDYLGVAHLEDLLELFLVANLDHRLQTLGIGAGRPNRDRVDIRIARGRGREPQHGQSARVADPDHHVVDGERFCALLLGGTRRLRIAHADDDRDPVAFGDPLAQPSS